MLSETLYMSLVLFTRDESVTFYCDTSRMIVSAFCFFSSTGLFISLVLSHKLRWTIKFILVNQPQ